ncbi:MAG: phosphoenolpyruvate--protein phosphotransferase [Chloroflexi bacterium]|nr:phosphoenolpyruvate--protein phosphotransferase [Chloroflexota bacterium]MDL1945041.1 phosphoenolpyruvate--protein phosphotransferase [Chloroflexi bacterium CFX2]
MTVELKGIPAAPGLAKGPALRWDQRPLQIPKFVPADSQAEKTRLGGARQNAAMQLRELANQVAKQIGEAEASLFEAQAMFLEDAVLVQKAEGAIDSGMNAEQAWHDACEYFASQLEAMPDETLRARSADVRDVGRRVLEILTGVQAAPALTKQSIILARDLAPSQTAVLDKSKVLAFCTAEGGPTSHTAILAKALGIPAIVGLGDAVLDIPDETLLLVDGNTGALASNPTPDLVADFGQRILADGEKRQREHELAAQPSLTRDGHRIEIAANVGSVEDARLALQHGAEGIGLLRTEFLFLNRSQPPDEQTQYSAHRTILDLMGSRPVVVRTLDVGGDKEVPYLDFGHEANPFLGYRAIRISLDHPDDFKVQLRALLRAGAGHDLRIMFPMIASLEEVIKAKGLLAEAQMELRSAGREMAENVQIGIMVEIPSVALLAERFAREVNFFSIGTNDLTQYTLAAERGNKRVSHLNDPCHPAVLKEIQQVVLAAHRAGIWVGVCGEMAGDSQAIPILLGLGVDELSMSPRQIPSAKQVVRNWSLADAQELARRALEMDNARAVRRMIGDYY